MVIETWREATSCPSGYYFSVIIFRNLFKQAGRNVMPLFKQMELIYIPDFILSSNSLRRLKASGINKYSKRGGNT